MIACVEVLACSLALLCSLFRRTYLPLQHLDRSRGSLPDADGNLLNSKLEASTLKAQDGGSNFVSEDTKLIREDG